MVAVRAKCNVPTKIGNPPLALARIDLYPGAMKYMAIVVGCLCAPMLPLRGAEATNELSALVEVAAPGETRYGLFNWLDRRSDYGQGVFPEPFLVDDSDLEPGEARLDWLHTGMHDSRNNVVKGEVEKGFGLMTVELEVPYEYDTAPEGTTCGFDNINAGVRYPFYQFVSPDGCVDSTLGLGIEVGIPTGSEVSKNAELVPKIFDDLKIGNFTTQAVLGYSALFGPGEEGGRQTFEYGFVFGYTLPHRQLPLPGVLETIPVLELLGETGLNKDGAGHNSLIGNAGVRLNLKAIGRIQPRPGIGFVFPVDSGAGQDLHWGVITSLVFQF